jgi:hypothetical protein
MALLFPPSNFTGILVLFSVKMYDNGMVRIGLISLISVTKTDKSVSAVLKFIDESGGRLIDIRLTLLADFHRRNSILLTNFMQWSHFWEANSFPASQDTLHLS